MRDESDRDSVCERYDLWLASKPELVASAKMELRGKDLVCWCSPARCHADTLLKIANEDTP